MEALCEVSDQKDGWLLSTTQKEVLRLPLNRQGCAVCRQEQNIPDRIVTQSLVPTPRAYSNMIAKGVKKVAT